MPEPHHTPETPSRTKRYPTLSQHHPGSGTTSKNDLSHRYHRRKSPSFLRSGITHPSHRAGPDLDVWRLEDPTRHGRQHDAFFHLPRRDHLPGFVLLLARAVPRHIGDERTGAVLCTFWTRHKELLRSTVSLTSFFFRLTLSFFLVLFPLIPFLFLTTQFGLGGTISHNRDHLLPLRLPTVQHWD